MEIYDTPGASDIKLKTWIEEMKKAKNPVNVLVWILSIKGSNPFEGFIAGTIDYIFENLSPDKIILVWTHCDQSDAKSWEELKKKGANKLEILNKNLKKKIDLKNIVYFGTKPLRDWQDNVVIESWKFIEVFQTCLKNLRKEGPSITVNQKADPAGLY